MSALENDRLRSIINALPALISYVDAQQRYQFNNAAYTEWFGGRQKSHQGRTVQEVLGDAAYERVREHVEAALAGERRTFETWIPYQDAGTRFVRADYIPDRDERGRVNGFFAFITDLSEWEAITERLRASEERFRATFEQAAVGMAHLREDGRWLLVNQRLCEILGYPREQLLKLNFQDITHPEDLDTDLAQAQRLIAGEIPSYSIEKRYIRPNGASVWAHLTIAPVRRGAGKPTYYVAVIEDISPRKDAEEALRREQEFRDQLIETAQTIILVLDPAGRIVRFNPYFEKLSGYTLAEVEGERWIDTFLPPRDRPAIRRIFSRSIAGTRTHANANPIVTKDGRERLIQWSDAPLTDSQGRFTHLLCIGHDITEQRAAQEALRASEERLRSIVTTAGDAIITHDERGVIDGFNPAAERMFGYAAQEALGQNLKILMPSPYREEHDGYLKRYCATGEKHVIGTVREVIAQRKDGSQFPVELAVSEVIPRRLFTGIVRDISARKAMEKQVVEAVSEERLRIGQDLHDSVGQELAGLRHLARTLSEVLSERRRPEAELAHRIGEVAASAHQQVRALSRGLAPVALDDEGLMSALADLAESTSRLHGIQCEFHCPTAIVIHDVVRATHLYRIVQEAVANAIRHGRASRIVVSLLQEDGAASLTIQDNGAGLSDPDSGQKGIGLKVAAYRADQIGATLRVDPGECEGVVVTCRFRLMENES
jgi:two-component system, LuxR family, sensor kinase FixL